jgi:hypothetical protein
MDCRDAHRHSADPNSHRCLIRRRRELAFRQLAGLTLPHSNHRHRLRQTNDGARFDVFADNGRPSLRPDRRRRVAMVRAPGIEPG